jgi:phosphopantetheinyl transferase
MNKVFVRSAVLLRDMVTRGGLGVIVFRAADLPAGDRRLGLHDKDLAQARSYVHPENRHSFLAGRAMLQRAMPAGMRLQSLRFGPHGKPWLPGADHFSLSRSQGLVALLVCARGPVGVDIEMSAGFDGFRDAVESSCSRAEIGALRAKTGVDATLCLQRIWTRKEAIAKAIGTGIGLDLAGIETHAARRFEQAVRCGAWQVLSVQGELHGHVLSIAFRQPVSCLRWIEVLSPGQSHPASDAGLVVRHVNVQAIAHHEVQPASEVVAP